jgi:hypothetical protein
VDVRSALFTRDAARHLVCVAATVVVFVHRSPRASGLPRRRISRERTFGERRKIRPLGSFTPAESLFLPTGYDVVDV